MGDRGGVIEIIPPDMITGEKENFNMKLPRFFMIATLTTLIFATLLSTAGCSTTSQSQTSASQSNAPQQGEANMPGQGGPGGPGGQMDGQAPGHGGRFNTMEIACEILGLTQEELMEKMQEDTTLVDIAAEQGLSEEEFKDALLVAMTAEIEQQVSDGTLTQEQADAMLEQLQEMIESGQFMMGGPPGGGGPPGQQGEPPEQPTM